MWGRRCSRLGSIGTRYRGINGRSVIRVWILRIWERLISSCSLGSYVVVYISGACHSRNPALGRCLRETRITGLGYRLVTLIGRSTEGRFHCLLVVACDILSNSGICRHSCLTRRKFVTTRKRITRKLVFHLD